MKNKNVISALGTWFNARQNNLRDMNSGGVAPCWIELRKEWFHKFTERIEFLLENRFYSSMPFSQGVIFDFDDSEDNKLVFHVSYRHDTDYEPYEEWDDELDKEVTRYPKQFCGYSEWRIVVTPSFALDFEMDIILESDDVELKTDEFEFDITQESIAEYLSCVFSEEFDHNDVNNYPEDERARILELRQTPQVVVEETIPKTGITSILSAILAFVVNMFR